MQNKNYSDLFALIQALAGVDAFTTSEQTKILAMANRRLWQAYQACPVWARYFVASQARPINSSGVIPRTYDETAGIRSVSSATRSSAIVTIVTSASVDFCEGMYVTISGLTGSVSPNGSYQVAGITSTNNTNDTFTYNLTTTDTNFEVYTGTGVVSPVAIPVISDINRIFTADPFTSHGYREIEYYEDFAGCHPINPHGTNLGYWMCFKEEWDGPYEATATTIPDEFFYFAAHATYADFLRMDGQTEKAMAEENLANEYLVVELDKPANQRNINNAFRRISTYTSRQFR